MQGDLRTHIGIPSTETVSTGFTLPTTPRVYLPKAGQDEFVTRKKPPPDVEESMTGDELALSTTKKPKDKGFSVVSALGHFAKGVVSPVVNLIKNPVAALPMLAIGGLGLLAFGSAASIVLGTVGIAFGVYQGGKFVQKLANAKNGEESAKAFEHLGEAASSIGFVGAFAKYDLKRFGFANAENLGFFSGLKHNILQTPNALKRAGGMIKSGEVFNPARKAAEWLGFGASTQVAPRPAINNLPSSTGRTNTATITNTAPPSPPTVATSVSAKQVARLADRKYFFSLSDAERIEHVAAAMHSNKYTSVELVTLLEQHYTQTLLSQSGKTSRLQFWKRVDMNAIQDKANALAVLDLEAAHKLRPLPATPPPTTSTSAAATATKPSRVSTVGKKNIPAQLFEDYALLSPAKRRKKFETLTREQQIVAIEIENIISGYLPTVTKRSWSRLRLKKTDKRALETMLKEDLAALKQAQSASHMMLSPMDLANTPLSKAATLDLYTSLARMTPKKRAAFIHKCTPEQRLDVLKINARLERIEAQVAQNLFNREVTIKGVKRKIGEYSPSEYRAALNSALKGDLPLVGFHRVPTGNIIRRPFWSYLGLG